VRAEKEKAYGTELTFFDMGSQDINDYNTHFSKKKSVNNEICFMIKSGAQKGRIV